MAVTLWNVAYPQALVRFSGFQEMTFNRTHPEREA